MIIRNDAVIFHLIRRGIDKDQIPRILFKASDFFFRKSSERNDSIQIPITVCHKAAVSIPVQRYRIPAICKTLCFHQIFQHHVVNIVLKLWHLKHLRNADRSVFRRFCLFCFLFFTVFMLLRCGTVAQLHRNPRHIFSCFCRHIQCTVPI